MTVILEGVAGSTAYGLATAASDVDYLGVYVAPTDQVLGLKGPAAVTKSIVSHDPDRTMHEVGKYLSLALKCNPTILDLLWLPGYEVCIEAGQKLLDIRGCLLHTPGVVSAYSGYAWHQAKRLENRAAEGKKGFDSDTGNRIAKHARHCFRLLLQAEIALATGRVQVDMSDRRAEIFEAGERAEQDPASFVGWIDERVRRIHEIDSVLPDSPDVEAVNRVLIEIRRSAQ